jgi:hypothetical protein
MDPKTMEPYSAALLAYFDGEKNAELIFRRDDGVEARMQVSHFFRESGTFTDIENTKIAR